MTKRKPRITLTAEQVKELVHNQADGNLSTENHHDITLGSALVDPERITVIVRSVQDGKISDEQEAVWLVGKGPRNNGYRIVMRDDGYFGLASSGFPHDKYPVLVGWYGDLLTTFLGM
jgi:hypothetical protein